MESTNNSQMNTLSMGKPVVIGRGSESQTRVQEHTEAVSPNLDRVEARRVAEKREKAVEAKKPEVEVRKNETVVFADFIAEKAKKDGVDAALEELAREENSKKKELLTDNKPKVEETQDKKEKPEDKIEELKTSKNIKLEKPMDAYIKNLEEKVKTLSAKNEELTKRMDELSDMNHAAILTAQQLAEALRELIDKEEDKEKKDGFQKLLEALTLFLMAFMPGKEEEKQKGKEEAEEGSIVDHIAA